MSCDPVKLWNTVDPENPLAQLAKRVLSFCPSSASVERLFSSMGNIKTKKRNRMLPQKLRDLAFLQLELRQQQARNGLVRQRLKRTLGNEETTSSPVQPVPGRPDDAAVVEELRTAQEGDSESEISDDEHSNLPMSSLSLADLNKDKSVGRRSRNFASLVEGYESDDSDLEGESSQIITDDSNGPSMPRTVRVFFGQQRHLLIEKLFNWSVEEGWDKFWFDGVKNCRQEMEFYELVTTAEDVMGKESGGAKATDVEIGASSHQPIVINDM